MIIFTSAICQGQAEKSDSAKMAEIRDQGIEFITSRTKIRECLAKENEDRPEMLKLERSKTVYFLPGSGYREKVGFNITPEYNSLEIKILCKVKFGTMNVSVYNPNGVLQDHITVNGGSPDPKEVSAEKELVTGTLEKKFVYPMPGQWTLRFTPSFTKAEVSYIISQQSNPKTN